MKKAPFTGYLAQAIRTNASANSVSINSQDTQLGQGLHGEVHHDTDDNETNDQRSRTTRLEGTTRAHEKTRSNSTTYESSAMTRARSGRHSPRTNGDHLHMAALELALEGVVLGCYYNIVGYVLACVDVVHRMELVLAEAFLLVVSIGASVGRGRLLRVRRHGCRAEGEWRQ